MGLSTGLEFEPGRRATTEEVIRVAQVAGARDAEEAYRVGGVVGDLAGFAPTFGVRPEDDRDTALCVMNPLPERRTEVVTRLV